MVRVSCLPGCENLIQRDTGVISLSNLLLPFSKDLQNKPQQEGGTARPQLPLYLEGQPQFLLCTCLRAKQDVATREERRGTMRKLCMVT